jgi:hypothetical protein
MLNELIQKIATQTGQPVETVTPVVGALLAHLGDVLPAPIAHQVAIFLGVHDDAEASGTGAATDGASGASGAGGLLGSLAGSFGGGGTGGSSNAGAAALVNVAESLLGGFLAGRR